MKDHNESNNIIVHLFVTSVPLIVTSNHHQSTTTNIDKPFIIKYFEHKIKFTSDMIPVINNSINTRMTESESSSRVDIASVSESSVYELESLSELADIKIEKIDVFESTNVISENEIENAETGPPPIKDENIVVLYAKTPISYTPI